MSSISSSTSSPTTSSTSTSSSSSTGSSGTSGSVQIGSGLGIVNSLGIGSGILTSTVLNSLVQATLGPEQALYQSQIAAINTKISDLGTLKGLLSTFQGAAATLSTSLNAGAQIVTSSNTSLATATATSFAQSGNYSLEVDKIASSQQLVTQGYSSANAVVGTGTLTFSFGTTNYTGGGTSGYSFTPNSSVASQSIQITSSNDTLSGIRDAINNANIGVSASIIYNGSSYQLSISSKSTGANNSVQVGVTNSTGGADTATTDLGALAFNSSAVNLSQPTAAADALIKVNGISITSPSNNVGGAINGVTLNLLQASVGNPFNLSVGPDVTGLTKNVQSLVDAYNAFQTQYQNLAGYNVNSKTAGPLMGDPSLENAMNQMNNIMGSMVTGMTNASIHSLADLGITTDALTGQLSFNTQTFQSVLQANPQDVSTLFSSNGSTTDSLVSYVTASTSTQPGTYNVNVSQLATQGTLNGATNSGLASIATTPITIASGSNTLSVTVDGNGSGTITIPAGTYSSIAQLTSTLQAQINADSNLTKTGASVGVSYDSTNNRLVINSASYGSLSSISINSINSTLASQLGLSVGAGVNGLNVAGTINGVAATGVGQVLTGATGDASSGLAVEIQGGSTGARGTVTYVSGVAQQLNNALNSILGSNGAFTNETTALNSQISTITQQNTNLTNQMNSMQSTMAKEFSAYDSMISTMNSTSNYLTSFFNAQTGSGSTSSTSAKTG